MVNKKKMTPKQVVLKFLDAYNRNDLKGKMALMTDDFVRYCNTAKKWAPMKKKEWADMTERWEKAFPGYKWELQTIAACGNTVTVEVLETGTFQKPWVMPNTTIQPTGKSYSVRNAVVFKVKDGLIENYHLYTTINFIWQCGINPKDIAGNY